MTRPASSFLGIARFSLMIRKAKVLVRAFNSVGFIRRKYKFNQQSPIENQQFKNEIRASTNPLAAAAGSAGAGAVFLVGDAFAAKTAGTIYSSAAAVAVDGRRFSGAEKNALCPRDPRRGAFDSRAGAAAARIRSGGNRAARFGHCSGGGHVEIHARGGHRTQST